VIRGFKQLTQNDLSSFNEEQFMNYYKEAQKKGYEYLFDGVTNSDVQMQNTNNMNETEIKFYGTFTKRLRVINNTWEVSQGAGLVPPFKVYPLALDKETFTEEMKKLGVKEEKIKEYFNYKPDYTNF
jgi:hypothetical protein